MMLSLLSTRTVAIIDWFYAYYPNFDGDMPLDIFYKIFFIASDGKTVSCFNRFLIELTFLELGHKQGRLFSLREDEYLAFKKTLLAIELTAAAELTEKIKVRLALIEKNKKGGKK